MMWLKACPKCKGDLVLDKDHYGWYKSCIQCGYVQDQKDADQHHRQGTAA